MKKSKLFKKIALLALAILPGFLLGSAFSTWVLGEVIGTKKEIIPDTYIDDVRPNYELDANTYDVYVFPNWMYADYILEGIDKGLNIDTSYLDKFDAASAFDEKKSAFSSSTNVSSSDASFFGAWTDAADDSKYAYKHFVADTSITQNDFEKIGSPSCGAKDSKGYRLSFCGWSADVENVSELGFMNQGNFHYLSALDPLSNVDETALSSNSEFSIDGSSYNKKTVFIYPIYTSGKNYNSTSQQPVVRLHGDTAEIFPELNNDYIFQEEYYFSQDASEGNYSQSYYYYNNLVVKKDSIYYLDFTPIGFSSNGYTSYNPGTWIGGWYNYQTTANYSLTQSSLSLEKDSNGLYHPSYEALFAGSEAGKSANILGEGIYNILVYVGYPTSVNVSTNKPSAFTDLTKPKRPFLLCQDPLLNDANYAYRDVGNVRLKLYVKIEKIDDFRIVGKNVSFDYENGSSLYKYGNGTYSADGVINPYVDFEINNVRIDGMKTRTMNTFKYNGKRYSYYSNMFTIASNAYILDENERLTSVSAAEADAHSQDRLEKYPSSYYEFFASDTNEGAETKIFEVGGAQTDFQNIENAPLFQNHDFNQSKGYLKNLFRITENSMNYYNILVRAFYVYEDDGSLRISKVGIALAPHDSKSVRVYVYDGGIVNKTNIVRDSEGFIDVDAEFMKTGLIGSIEVESGASFAKDLPITPDNYDGSGKKWTVEDYLNYEGGRKFYEHQTELEFKIGSKISKNMVLFLRKPVS